MPAADTTERRDVVRLLRLLHLLYLAPGAAADTPCVALTARRRRCPHPLTYQVWDLGQWAIIPVPAARRRGHLTEHLTGTPMAVYDLTRLPCPAQLRWRTQRCPVHAASSAGDVALTEWEPFDTFAHHQHITPTVPHDHQEPGGAAVLTEEPRVLVCGSRRWPWPDTVTAVVDRLAARHGDRLVVIEGAATGADRAAHRWCEHHRLPAWRHRCYPVVWNAERQRRPRSWHWAGPERNQRMLLEEEPRLVIAFHEDLDPDKGAPPTPARAPCCSASRSGSPRAPIPTWVCGCPATSSPHPASANCSDNSTAPFSTLPVPRRTLEPPEAPTAQALRAHRWGSSAR